MSNCNRKRKCRDCGARHHTALCSKSFGKTDPTKCKNTKNEPQTAMSVTNRDDMTSGNILPTAQISLWGPGKGLLGIAGSNERF